MEIDGAHEAYIQNTICGARKEIMDFEQQPSRTQSLDCFCSSIHLFSRRIVVIIHKYKCVENRLVLWCGLVVWCLAVRSFGNGLTRSHAHIAFINAKPKHNAQNKRQLNERAIDIYVCGFVQCCAGEPTEEHIRRPQNRFIDDGGIHACIYAFHDYNACQQQSW